MRAPGIRLRVEVVIFNNAALDLLTALLTLALRRKKARWWSLALSVALGAAVGTVYPLLPAPAKICAAVLLPLVMTAGFHKFASFADYVVSLGVFLMLTFATGGAVLAAVAISGVELRGYSVLGFVALGAAAAVAGVWALPPPSRACAPRWRPRERSRVPSSKPP